MSIRPVRMRGSVMMYSFRVPTAQGLIDVGMTCSARLVLQAATTATASCAAAPATTRAYALVL